MNCHNCKCIVQVNSNFCGKCGAKLIRYDKKNIRLLAVGSIEIFLAGVRYLFQRIAKNNTNFLTRYSTSSIIAKLSPLNVDGNSRRAIFRYFLCFFILSIAAFFFIVKLGSHKSAGDVAISRYMPGTKYVYWSKLESPGLDNCSKTSSERCLSFSEWKDICGMAKDVTVDSVAMRAVLENSKTKALLEGGSLTNLEIVWGMSGAGHEACYVMYTAKGIYQGNSAKEVIQGIARSFLVKEDGKILITSWGLY